MHMNKLYSKDGDLFVTRRRSFWRVVKYHDVRTKKGAKHTKGLGTWRYSSCTFQTIPVTPHHSVHPQQFTYPFLLVRRNHPSKMCPTSSCCNIGKDCPDVRAQKIKCEKSCSCTRRYTLREDQVCSIIEAKGTLRRGHFVRLYHSIFLHSLFFGGLNRECPPLRNVVKMEGDLLEPQMNAP